MSENESPKIILTIPKDNVKFEGEFAIVDVGLTIEEFVRAIMDFASSPKKMVAIEKTEVEE